MNWRKVLLYIAVGVGLLVAIQLVLSVVWTVIGLAWAIGTSLATVAVIGAVGYATVKLLSWYFDFGAVTTADSDTTSSNSTDGNSADRVERLKDRYANGDLSEDEFEQQLEHELGGPDIDSIDRELSRERE